MKEDITPKFQSIPEKGNAMRRTTIDDLSLETLQALLESYENAPRSWGFRDFAINETKKRIAAAKKQKRG